MRHCSFTMQKVYFFFSDSSLHLIFYIRVSQREIVSFVIRQRHSSYTFSVQRLSFHMLVLSTFYASFTLHRETTMSHQCVKLQ